MGSHLLLIPTGPSQMDAVLPQLTGIWAGALEGKER